VDWSILIEWLVKLASGVLSIAGPALAVALISYIRAKTRKINDEALRQAIDDAVNAAEQLYGAGAGETKKQYVEAALDQKVLDYTTDQIEAAVRKNTN